MKKYILSTVFLLLTATAVFSITGFPYKQESLDVTTTTVSQITASIYQPGGVGSRIFPVLIQTHGTGYYRLDSFQSVGSTNFTPDVTSYHCSDGSVIEADHPEYFRIIAVTSDMTATVTSFSPQ